MSEHNETQPKTIVIQMTKDALNKRRTILIADEHFETFVKFMDAGAKAHGHNVLFEEQEDVL